MPLKPGMSIAEMLAELHSGKTYAKTRQKHGKKTADRQALAIALTKFKGRKTIAGG